MIKELFYQMFLRPIMPRYVEEGGGGGEGTPDIFGIEGDDWSTMVHEKFPDNAVMSNTKSPMDAFEQFQNAQKLLGKDRLPTPQDDWSDDDWGAHYERLGRPGTSADYKLDEVPEIEGYELNDEFMTKVKDGLHTAGLNGKQYQATMGLFFDWLKDSTTSAADASTARVTAAEEALKNEFGDKYEGEVARANNLLGEFASPEYIKQLADSGQGSDPEFVKMMIKIAGEFKDDSALGDSINSNLSASNKAMNDIAEMKGDDEFGKKLMNAEHPGHKQAVSRWQDAHKRAYPAT